jgi:hypothetical protein
MVRKKYFVPGRLELPRQDITINVSGVYMAWYVTILMGAYPFPGPLEGVGPKNQDFFGPQQTSCMAYKYRQTDKQD